MWLPPGLIAYIVDFIDVSNDPVVYKLENMEKYAPDCLLDNYSKYIIRSWRFRRQKIKICPKCRHFGIFQQRDENCIFCNFNPETIGILSETPMEIKNKIKKKALNRFLLNKINSIFPADQSHIITQKKTFSLSYLILGATKAGKQQNKYEIIRHSPNNRFI